MNPSEKSYAKPPSSESLAADRLSTLSPHDTSAPKTGVDLGSSFPREFGRYRLIRKLGEGGMGAVYFAHDTQLDRPVALKIPRFSPQDDDRILERFRNEARAAAAFHHPNLCPVYDVGRIGETHFLTMAYLEGTSLEKRLSSGPPMSPIDAARLVQQIASALAFAHRRGVVHRDLKPANIMIQDGGVPVVMDFGLARRSEPEVGRLTRSGEILGTPSFMAPEQVEGHLEAIGPGCDIYSLGVILYELLTGRLPFRGTMATVLAGILTKVPETPASIRPDVDSKLSAICMKAMAKKVEDRFADADQMAATLGEFLQSASSASVASPTARAKSGRRSGWRVASIALGVVAVCAAVAGVVFLTRSNDGAVKNAALDATDPPQPKTPPVKTKEAVASTTALPKPAPPQPSLPQPALPKPVPQPTPPQPTSKPPADAVERTDRPTIREALKKFDDPRVFPGAIALVADKDRIRSLDVLGYADVARKAPMQSDSLFAIGAQTQAFTAVALMILVDEGKVDLDDPIEKYLPELKGMPVVGKGKAATSRPAVRSVTVRDCLRHTNGLQIPQSLRQPQDGSAIKDVVHGYATIPLAGDPGVVGVSGSGSYIAARIIEIVTKTPYEGFLKRRVLDPLELKDTTFWPNEPQLRRLAGNYQLHASTDELVESPVGFLHHPLTDRKGRFANPSVGLLSTAEDLSRFCRMMLRHGTLDGKRILSEKAVAEMTRPQTADSGGAAWGLGFLISNGTYSHGGQLGTDMAVSVDRGVVLVWCAQFSTLGFSAREAFKKAALERFGR